MGLGSLEIGPCHPACSNFSPNPHLSALIRTYAHQVWIFPSLIAHFLLLSRTFRAPSVLLPCSFPQLALRRERRPISARNATPIPRPHPDLPVRAAHHRSPSSKQLASFSTSASRSGFRSWLRMVLRNASSVTHIIAPVNEQNSQVSNSPGFWLPAPANFQRVIAKAR